MKTGVRALIRDVEYYLPEGTLSDAALKQMFPDWPIEKMAAMTGVENRHISGPDEFASDLAVKAAEKLFANGRVKPGDIDFVILCTMCPDYQFPATACLVQKRLGIPTTCGAFDFNMGCSGYIYGLGLAKALIETGQAANVLFIASEVLTKILRKDDKSVQTIFGDGAAATWIGATVADEDFIGPFDYGTDGSIETMGALAGGARGVAKWIGNQPWSPEYAAYMNGTKVFNFALGAVPLTIRRALDKAGLDANDIDLFVFHQANRFMMEHLRKRMNIPAENFSVQMAFCGNTVSPTIPIALTEERKAGKLRDGMRLLLCGFGVGHSWGSVVVKWSPSLA